VFLRLKRLWITLPAVAFFAIVACAGQRIQVSDVVSPAHTDQQDALRHCRLLGVTPVGSGDAAILCAGDESWLARGHGSKLELKKLHPFAPGAGFTVGYLREGKVETIRQFPQLIRQIAIDHEGQAKIRDWSVARGSPEAAAAGSEGTVFVLFRHGDSRCYLNDLRTPERAAGRIVAWSRSCVTGSAGIIPRADRRHLLWMTTEHGIALGSQRRSEPQAS
jgi:hypothetical protein